MKLSSLDRQQFFRRLSSFEGVHIKTGPFNVCVKSKNACFSDLFSWFYRDFPLASQKNICDYHISLKRPWGIRRLWKPQVLFSIDNQVLFEPFPLSSALPLFEWGLNWCIATQAHRYLLLHASVVEKDGKAIVFPAFPGSGKSTLCAALVHRGWRLFSDEFGIVRPENQMVIPLPRPIPLKNESIDVIRRFAPDAAIGPLFPKTRKGTVAHLRAPASSVERMNVEAAPHLVIFPRYQSNAKLVLAPLSKAYALLKLATNAFNYQVLGKKGFVLVADIVRSCGCYNLTYGNLDEAINRLNELVDIDDE